MLLHLYLIVLHEKEIDARRVPGGRGICRREYVRLLDCVSSWRVQILIK